MTNVCTAEGCNRERGYGRRLYCEMHYYRVRRHGDPCVLMDRHKPEVKYRAAHARVRASSGPATLYRCVDCGCQAQHWSYKHTDPAELVSETGQPYSMDPSHYEPRCAACHALFDGTGANQYAR